MTTEFGMKIELAIGACAVSLLLYFVHKKALKIQQKQKKLQQFEQSYRQCKIHALSEQNLQKKSKRNENVIIEGVIPKEKAQFKQFAREISLYSMKTPESFLKHRSGNTFKAQTKENVPLIVDLRDCHISSKLLEQRIQKAKVFYQQYKSSMTGNCTYSLMAGTTMSLVGCISQDSNGNFIVKCKFLCLGVDCYGDIKSYFRNSIDTTFIELFGLLGVACVCFYLWVFKPLKCLLKKPKYLYGQDNAFSHFKKMLKFVVSPDSNLLCLQCRKQPANIVFQCGHISYCQECKNNMGKALCPQCNRESKQSLKLFFC